MKREYLKSLTILLTICVLAVIVKSQVLAVNNLHGPYLTDMTDSSVIITWYTDTKATGTVEYGFASDSLNNSVTELEKSITVVGNRHSVILTGLLPGTMYYYRVISKELTKLNAWNPVFGETYTGKTYSFTTHNANKTDFTFYYLTDIQSDTAQMNALIDLIDYSKCDFVVYGGDHFSGIETEAQVFDQLIDPSITKFASTKPFIYVRGDKDYNGAYSRNLKSIIPTSSNKYYYGFGHGKASMIVLDTGIGSKDSNPGNYGLMACQPYRAEEFSWLEKYTASNEWKQSPFRIAFMHDPEYGYGDDGNKQKWKSLMSKAGTHLVLAGHNLSYTHNLPGTDGEAYHKLIVGEDQLARVNVSGTQITVTVYSISGAIFDTFTISLKEKMP